MLFAADRLSLGLVLPLQPRLPEDIDFQVQLDFVRRAEQAGFEAIWVRDVPLNNDEYPDPVGHSDPFVLLGAIAASTSWIQLVTGAVVLTLRHPLHIAKAALSLQSLSNNRFVLGLGSGDRPSEFRAFGRDFENRKELFRRNWASLSAALGPDQTLLDEGLSPLSEFALRPRPAVQVPMLAVGSASQSLEWIARNATGWATYHRELPIQKDRIALWHAAIAKSGDGFRSFSQSMNLDLLDDAAAPATTIELGYRCGRMELVRLLSAMREAGVHHVMFNLAPGRRGVAEVIDEIGSDVIPSIAV